MLIVVDCASLETVTQVQSFLEWAIFLTSGFFHKLGALPDHESKFSHACQLKEAQGELLIVSTSEKNCDVPSSIVHLNISGEVARSHMRSESVSILVQLSVQINDSYVVAHPKGQHHQAQGIKDAH